MNPSEPAIYSTIPGKRIVSIDVLRGFAVLGILIMNIQSFSMISTAYINPMAFGDMTGINKWVWILSNFFAAGKFMSIFSMLFGAGIVLFTERATAKGRKAGPLHYRRNFWLLLFGLAHAYLIWYGDILVTYSLCGFLVFLFRNLKPRTLVIIGSMFFIVPMIVYLFFGFTIQYWPEESYNANMETWMPGAEKIQDEIETMQSGWITQMGLRVPAALFLQTFLFFLQVFWRVTALMLFGMAFYKWGIFSASRSRKFYIRMMISGFLTGFLIVGLGIYENFRANWSMEYSMFLGSQYNYLGSVHVAIGYIGLIMLICKSNAFTKLKYILSSVGKMAFTNYILMSIICTLIFYGHGLGLFGEVQRWGQILIILPVWIFILVASPLWLRRFQYGPLEGLWRSLTYWKRPGSTR